MEPIHHTRHRTLFKASASEADWSVRAVLSLPVEDLAGDVVLSDGLDFSRHAADPWVDLEHGYEPSVGRRPVGWARKSLSVAGEPYAVEHAVLDVPAVGKCKLHVGTTYFDRDDPLSRQVYFLVQKGALPGVSLEFRPVDGFMKSRGRSRLEARDAYEFAKALVVRWTHCVEPVCPGALTVLKSLPPELDALAKILRDRAVEGEALHPLITKSLARYQPTTTLAAATPTVGKAMPDALDGPDTVYDADASESSESPAKPTAAAHYNCADGILQVIDQAESDLEMSEHTKGKKFLLARLEKMRAEAEQIKAMGDKIDAETADDDGDGTPDAEEDPDVDMTTDDDGTLKAVRDPYRAIMKAVRESRGVKPYSMTELVKGIERAKAEAAAAALVETPGEAAERLAAEAEVEKARKRLKRSLAFLG